MDLDAVKVFLEAQNKTFKTALNIVVEQLKSRIEQSEGAIKDLVRSLEFSQAEVKDLQSEVRQLKKSETDCKTTIDGLKRNIEELERRLNYQEDYNRRNNIRISGFQEKPGGETWEETAQAVSKLLEDKLQLPPMKLERAHRTGPSIPSRTRTVVARFERYGDREAVIRNARKLKGTGIFINEDLCPASQELKKKQFPQIKQAREGKIAFFRHTKLIIRERNNQEVTGGGSLLVSRTTDDVNGSEPRLRTGSTCGAAAGGGGSLSLSVVDGDVAAGTGAGDCRVRRPQLLLATMMLRPHLQLVKLI